MKVKLLKHIRKHVDYKFKNKDNTSPFFPGYTHVIAKDNTWEFKISGDMDNCFTAFIYYYAIRYFWFYQHIVALAHKKRDRNNQIAARRRFNS